MSKHGETYNYQYDGKTKECISVKGFKNGKLIYGFDIYRVKDSFVEKTMYNDELLKAKEKKVTYYSADSLTQTILSYYGGSEPEIYIKKYSPKKVLLETIDSTYAISREKYFYDDLGRLSKKIFYQDSALYSATEYNYGDYKTTVSTYSFFSGKKDQISNEEIKLYNNYGLLVYERTMEFDKPEGIVSDGKTIAQEPKAEAGFIMAKSYKNNRLIQVQINHGAEVGNCYEIEYR